MGDRKGISGGKCSPWCAIKEKLDSLWDKTHNAFTHVNGYEADGSQNLRINGSEGIIVETVSGNEIRLIGAAAEPYTAVSPIVINPETRTVSINMDSAPVLESENAITSGGVYAADQTLQNNISAEQSARIAQDNALGARIDNVINGTTQVGNAAHAANSDNAQYLGSSTNTIGNDTHPVKIVNGQAVAVSNELVKIEPISNVYITVFGTNKYNGYYYSAPIPITNANSRTITVGSGSVIGVAPIAASEFNFSSFKDCIILGCSNDSVAGRSCNMQIDAGVSRNITNLRNSAISSSPYLSINTYSKN